MIRPIQSCLFNLSFFYRTRPYETYLQSSTLVNEHAHLDKDSLNHFVPSIVKISIYMPAFPSPIDKSSQDLLRFPMVENWIATWGKTIVVDINQSSTIGPLVTVSWLPRWGCQTADTLWYHPSVADDLPVGMASSRAISDHQKATSPGTERLHGPQDHTQVVRVFHLSHGPITAVGVPDVDMWWSLWFLV